MAAIVHVGSAIEGGLHCHGHDHGPQPSPGSVVEGSAKVFVSGSGVAREGDRGYSAVCCGGVGGIELRATQSRVFVDARAVVTVGAPTKHCGVAPGVVTTGTEKVTVNG